MSLRDRRMRAPKEASRDRGGTADMMTSISGVTKLRWISAGEHVSLAALITAAFNTAGNGYLTSR